MLLHLPHFVLFAIVSLATTTMAQTATTRTGWVGGRPAIHNQQLDRGLEFRPGRAKGENTAAHEGSAMGTLV